MKLLKIANVNLPSKGPTANATKKHEMHPNTLKIKSVFKSIKLFNFSFVNNDNISKIITSLDSTKKTSGVIPTEIVNLVNKEICKDLAHRINESIKKNQFPNELKASDITLRKRIERKLNKEIYRHVSVLPTISKIVERVLFNQLTNFSNKFLSPLLCGFRKGYSTQFAGINFLKK